MTNIENLISSIIHNKSISIDEMAKVIDDESEAAIPAEKLEQLIDIDFDNKWNEEFWKMILNAVSDDSLSDRMIGF